MRFLVRMMLLAMSVPTCAMAYNTSSPWKAWPAIRVTGRDARIWGRTYRVGDLGLPAQITSAGRTTRMSGNLLAGSVRLEVAAGGQAATWSGSGHWAKVEPSSARYSYRGRAAELALKVDGLIEPDGMWRFDVELTASRPLTLDSLRLVIPINRRYANLMHWYPLPRNWPQVTFFDHKFPNSGARPRSWESPFTPFVWIGDEERGIEWFCESDEGWRPLSDKSALTLAETPRAVEFVVHIVERPMKLDKLYRITFGLQAGPVKPKQDSPRYAHWGTYGMESEIRPGAVPPVTQLDYLKGLGVKFVGMHEEWTDFQGMPRVTQPEKLRQLIEAAHERGMGLVLYHSMAIPDIAPEFASMAEDSLCEPRTANYVHSRQPPQHDYPACHRGEYSALWTKGIAKLFDEYGIDGLYLDGAACPIPCANSRHGCGYTDEERGLRPTCPIFATREAMKRLKAICDLRGKPTLIVAHMSSMITLPTLSFADVLLTGEQYWKSPADFRPPLEFFRAECMGHNHGIPTHFIGYSPLGGEYARTMIGLHDAPSPWCPGGTDMWRLYTEFDADGAQWAPYWSEKPLASANVLDVLVSGFAHPDGRTLLAVGNVSASSRKVTLTLRGKFRSAKDALTGDTLEIADGRIELELGPESLRWVRLESSAR